MIWRSIIVGMFGMLVVLLRKMIHSTKIDQL
jgi:hypothetical protein